MIELHAPTHLQLLRSTGISLSTFVGEEVGDQIRRGILRLINTQVYWNVVDPIGSTQSGQEDWG